MLHVQRTTAQHRLHSLLDAAQTPNTTAADALQQLHVQSAPLWRLRTHDVAPAWHRPSGACDNSVQRGTRNATGELAPADRRLGARPPPSVRMWPVDTGQRVGERNEGGEQQTRAGDRRLGRFTFFGIHRLSRQAFFLRLLLRLVCFACFILQIAGRRIPLNACSTTSTKSREYAFKQPATNLLGRVLCFCSGGHGSPNSNLSSFSPNRPLPPLPRHHQHPQHHQGVGEGHMQASTSASRLRRMAPPQR